MAWKREPRPDQPLAKHFAGACICRIEEGRVEILGIEYTDHKNNDEIQLKVPGGTDKGHFGESLNQTFDREIFKEVGFRCGKKVEIHFAQKGPDHTQHFFLIPIQLCEGELRTEPIEDGEETLSPPEWWNVEEKWDVVYHTHRPAFQKAFIMMLSYKPGNYCHYDPSFLVKALRDTTMMVIGGRGEIPRIHARVINYLAEHCQEFCLAFDHQLLQWAADLVPASAQVA